MTQRDFENTLLRAMEKALNVVKGQAPVRTGELKNSIQLVATATGYDIIVTAPHMPYTEEKWVSPQWKGRANPNEGWFRIATELVFRLIRSELSASGTYQGKRS